MFNAYVMPRILSNAAALGIMVNGKGAVKKSIYDDVVGEIVKIVMQMIMRKSDNTTMQTTTNKQMFIS